MACPTMTTEQYSEMSESFQGFCLACGEFQDSCEPDARARTCESCGERQVYGLEELLIMGKINFCE